MNCGTQEENGKFTFWGRSWASLALWESWWKCGVHCGRKEVPFQKKEHSGPGMILQAHILRSKEFRRKHLPSALTSMAMPCWVLDSAMLYVLWSWELFCFRSLPSICPFCHTLWLWIVMLFPAPSWACGLLRPQRIHHYEILTLLKEFKKKVWGLAFLISLWFLLTKAGIYLSPILCVGKNSKCFDSLSSFLFHHTESSFWKVNSFIGHNTEGFL